MLGLKSGTHDMILGLATETPECITQVELVTCRRFTIQPEEVPSESAVIIIFD